MHSVDAHGFQNPLDPFAGHIGTGEMESILSLQTFDSPEGAQYMMSTTSDCDTGTCSSDTSGCSTGSCSGNTSGCTTKSCLT